MRRWPELKTELLAYASRSYVDALKDRGLTQYSHLHHRACSYGPKIIRRVYRGLAVNGCLNAPTTEGHNGKRYKGYSPTLTIVGIQFPSTNSDIKMAGLPIWSTHRGFPVEECTCRGLRDRGMR